MPTPVGLSITRDSRQFCDTRMTVSQHREKPTQREGMGGGEPAGFHGPVEGRPGADVRGGHRGPPRSFGLPGPAHRDAERGTQIIGIDGQFGAAGILGGAIAITENIANREAHIPVCFRDIDRAAVDEVEG